LDCTLVNKKMEGTTLSSDTDFVYRLAAAAKEMSKAGIPHTVIADTCNSSLPLIESVLGADKGLPDQAFNAPDELLEQIQLILTEDCSVEEIGHKVRREIARTSQGQETPGRLSEGTRIGSEEIQREEHKTSNDDNDISSGAAKLYPVSRQVEDAGRPAAVQRGRSTGQLEEIKRLLSIPLEAAQVAAVLQIDQSIVELVSQSMCTDQGNRREAAARERVKEETETMRKALQEQAARVLEEQTRALKAREDEYISTIRAREEEVTRALKASHEAAIRAMQAREVEAARAKKAMEEEAARAQKVREEEARKTMIELEALKAREQEAERKSQAEAQAPSSQDTWYCKHCREYVQSYSIIDFYKEDRPIFHCPACKEHKWRFAFAADKVPCGDCNMPRAMFATFIGLFK
jgi:rubrerythrin